MAALTAVRSGRTNNGGRDAHGRGAPALASQSMPACRMATGQTMGACRCRRQRTASPPTATAMMVCSDDIKTKVQQVLELTGPAANHVRVRRAASTPAPITCRSGPMVLSVQAVARTSPLPHAYTRAEPSPRPTKPLLGLGEQGLRQRSGVAVVMKDNETLGVDTRASARGVRQRSTEAYRPGLRDRLRRPGLLDRQRLSGTFAGLYVLSRRGDLNS